jgi:hypothetical protein
MKKTKSAATKAKESASPSRLIDGRIKELGDWRGETLARVRVLIKEACPEVARGAALDDPSGVFNSSLEGNVRRAIDIREGEKINEKALKALVRAAAALNKSKAKR